MTTRQADGEADSETELTPVRAWVASPEADVEHLQRLATLGTLAAASAHEVNNVVTHLLASLQRAANACRAVRESSAPDDEALERLEAALEMSHECCDRLRGVARGMTSCARAPTNERTLVHITDSLDEAILLVSSDIEDMAMVQREYEQALPPVRANAGKLIQVFVNLLVNAIHSLEPGIGRNHCVTVEARLTDEWVCVQITDTGTGIAPDDLGRIFDPFFTTKPEDVGTGLGLPVSRDIVNALGGQITVTSKLGQGTAFAVFLPCA